MNRYVCIMNSNYKIQDIAFSNYNTQIYNFLQKFVAHQSSAVYWMWNTRVEV